MDKLHVEAEQTAQAAPAIVWALVSDAATYPRWGPWSEVGYRRPGDTSPGGPGAVYWLRSSRRYGMRRPVSVERILDAEEGRRLAYTVIGGIPVRNYRAEVTLAPVAGGTRIRWAASWDRTPWRAVWCNDHCEGCTRRSLPTWRAPRRSRLRRCGASATTRPPAWPASGHR